MNANVSGYAALDDMIERLRGLPAELEAAAPGLAQDFKAEADRAIAEGRSVDGVKWAPKKDGGRALVNAAKAVRAYATGALIFLEVRGVEAIHNFGTKRVPARPILPSGPGVPLKLGQAIRKGLVQAFEKRMGGRRG